MSPLPTLKTIPNYSDCGPVLNKNRLRALANLHGDPFGALDAGCVIAMKWTMQPWHFAIYTERATILHA
ncbi:MAG: hypothetical protein ACRES7_06235 [Gammaproteobacteria bacterium]